MIGLGLSLRLGGCCEWMNGAVHFDLVGLSCTGLEDCGSGCCGRLLHSFRVVVRGLASEGTGYVVDDRYL